MKARSHKSIAVSLAVLAGLSFSHGAAAQDRPGNAETPKPTLNETEQPQTPTTKRPARIGSLLEVVRPDFSADGQDEQAGELSTGSEPSRSAQTATPLSEAPRPNADKAKPDNAAEVAKPTRSPESIEPR